MSRPLRRPGVVPLLLVQALSAVGIRNIPPVTFLVVLANIAIYYEDMVLKKPLFPPVQQVCISGYHVWYRYNWYRLVLAAVFHGDEWHLYYNMTSFLSKAMRLEQKFKSGYFAFLLAVFTVMTGIVMVGISIMMSEFTSDGNYLMQCAIGLSGVIFALKVLVSHYSLPVSTSVFGIPLPPQWVNWAELLLIHILVPRSSFIGHLAGILVGLLYVKGPLKVVMDNIWSLMQWFTSHSQTQTYTDASGTTGYRSQNLNSSASQGWRYGQTTGYRARSSGTPDPVDTRFNTNPGQHNSFRYPTRMPEPDNTLAHRYSRESLHPNSNAHQFDRNAFYSLYTGGFSEEEQLQRALAESSR